MKYTLFVLLVLFMACGDGNNTDEPELRDPAEVHPLQEAIPDSMQIREDSVIMPKTDTTR